VAHALLFHAAAQEFLLSLTVSATPDENVSPSMPLSFSAEVLWPRTAAAKVADTMIEARFFMSRSVTPFR
jgi:hypothetical protein